MKKDIFLDFCLFSFILECMRRLNNSIYNQLKSLGIFSTKEALGKLKISQPTLSRWATEGRIKRINRGLYIHSEFTIDPEELDFAIACNHFGPQSAVGGLSALFHYQLIEQIPQQIWMVVPSSRKDQSSECKYKCLRTNTTLEFGIDNKKYFRITNIERALLEAMKFATKIGPRIVIAATRKAFEEALTTESKLGKMAKKLEMKTVLKKYWEAIV